MPQNQRISDPESEQRLFIARMLTAGFVIFLVMGLIAWRYYFLQIENHQNFVALSDNNRLHLRPVPPTRGLIFDRNGVLLADNKPSFTLKVIKERVQDIDALLTELKSLIEISDDQVERFRKALNRNKPYAAVPLRYRLTEEERAILAVNGHLLPGVEVIADLVRFYPLGEELTHVLGYVGRINERDLRNFTEEDVVAYQGTDSKGKKGIEYSYERELLGVVGSENVETNSRGRVMRVISRTDPVPGKNLSLFLDSRLQRVAYEEMKDKVGSVVALDARTGGVLAMVSTPSYNPNSFVTGIGHKEYAGLIDSIDRPLLNRSLQSTYPPASTVKPMHALTALEEGVVSADYKMWDPGYYQLPNEERLWRDWTWKTRRAGHGRVGVYEAIMESCDTFFWSVSYRLGIDNMSKYAHQFGLGEPTGIDLAGEHRGIMGSREWKRIHRGGSWYPGDTLNVSIGQGFMTATPMQLAAMTMRMANQGKARLPRVVKGIGGNQVELEPPQQFVTARESNWKAVKRGMEAVIHGSRGTARGIRDNLQYRIAGKTGTAQVVAIAQGEKYDSEALSRKNRDHALFIAYAPADDPQIAVAVIVENGEKSIAASSVARKVMDAWLLEYSDNPLQTNGGKG